MKQGKTAHTKECLAFLEMLVLLLENGFSIQEGLEVMTRSKQFSDSLLQQFQTNLIAGQSLGVCFAEIGLSPQEVTQIQLAEFHGNIAESLNNLLNHRKLVQKQTKELQKIMTYPLVLMFFSFFLLLSMRYILLPQLLASSMIDQNHWGILFLTFAPIGMGIMMGVGLLMIIGSRIYFRQKSLLEAANFLRKLPIFGHLYCFYQTSYFSLEWGKLFKEGLEVKQILHELSHLPNQSLMVALAQELHLGLNEGILLTEQLKNYAFLTPEFSFIIFQGEIKGKLGEELILYSQILTNKLVEKVEWLLKIIQPLVFLLLAMVIITIYVAMFLPIYGSMGGMLE